MDDTAIPAAIATALAAARGPDVAAALAAARQAVTAHPADPRPRALLARALIRSGALDAAEAELGEAEAIHPDSVPLALERMALARLRGDASATVAASARLARLAPNHAPIWIDHARTLAAVGDWHGAGAAWKRVIELQPGQPIGHIGLVQALLAGAQAAAAAEAARAALAIAPGSVELKGLLGIALLRSGPAAVALPWLEDVHAALPGWRDIGLALLEALKRTNADAGRILALSRALANDLPPLERARQLALDECVFGSPAEMHRHVAAGLAIAPDDIVLRWLGMQVPAALPFPDAEAESQFLGQWRSHLEVLERSPLDQLGSETAESLLLAASSFHVHYLGLTLEEELRRLGGVISHLSERAVGPLPAITPRPRDGRVRLGICSGHLRRHTVTKLFGALIEGLDRNRIELSLFNTGTVADATTERLAARADHFFQRIVPLAQWADAIRSRDLDVLVHLDVGMDGRSQALAALRLAPVQALLWGHPVTSGLAHVDYFLTAADMEPPDGDRHYTERLVRLPGIGTCYRAPPEPASVPAELLSLPRGEVLAFMPQMLQKLAPEFDTALARILSGAPGLRLAMTPFFREAETRRLRERLGRQCARHGVGLAPRLALCRWLTQDEWLAVARRADFGLDSFRWSGGNTSLEMFWFDTPIVTLPGPLMRGRHTFAMLRRMEIPELVAENVDDYVRIAVRLARSADFRAEMRGRIAERKHRLYDDESVVRAFEEFVVEAAGAAART